MATIAVSGAAIIRAGAGVGAVPDAAWDEWIESTERYLAGLVKHDIVTDWPTISGANLMLTEYAERMAAVDGVMYDMSGYTSRVEAEDIINVHIFKMGQIRKLIEDASVQDFTGV